MMPQAQLAAPYRHLSLTARLAIALNCAERFCSAHHIEHPELTRFFEYLWRFPLLPQHEFCSWEASRPRLVSVALGDEPMLPEISHVLDVASVHPLGFQALLACCVDIIWASFYTISHDDESLADLGSVLETTVQAGLTLQDPGLYSRSLFADRAGWGKHVAPEDVQKWRRHSADAV